MRRTLAVSSAAVVFFGFAVAAIAAPASKLIRGSVQAVSGRDVTIRSYSGRVHRLALTSRTKFAWVVPASLGSIRAGDFVGVGATGPGNGLDALEVAIFPPSMRGAGEGHYGWSVPAAIARADRHEHAASAGALPVRGTMTNGNVTSTSAGFHALPLRGTMTNGNVTSTSTAPRALPVRGTMTNGTAVSSSAGAAGGRVLTISYRGGRSRILVTPTTPVVRFVTTGRSAIHPGVKVFVVAGRGSRGRLPSAVFVAVGKNGLMPPM